MDSFLRVTPLFRMDMKVVLQARENDMSPP